MRPFPRTLRPRLVAALAAGALVAGSSLFSLTHLELARADDDLKDKQKKVRQEISAAHDELEESSAQARRTAQRLEAAQAALATARGELAVAKARVAAARIKDRQMQDRLDAAIARLEAARADLARGRAEMESQRDAVASMISDIYQQGDPRLLAFTAILNSKTPADLTHEMEARQVMVGTQTRVYDELRATEVLLQVQEDQVAEAKRETAQRRQEAAEHLATMRAAEQQAVDAAAAVRASVTESRSAKAAALAARRADLRMLRQLRAEEQHIAELLKRRAAARNPDGPTGGYLSSPASGGITSGYGYRIHPIYGYWGLHDGIDLAPGCGAPMRAAAGGTVLSSYWSDVYGNRLIVDHGIVHGVGLATIYNHAVRYTVGVGSHVERGEIIGYVGSTGWSTGCHLHFTVMVNGTAVDPLDWL